MEAHRESLIMEKQSPSSLNTPLTRRGFLGRAGSLASAAWMSTTLPAVLATSAHAREAHRSNAAFEVLTEEEAAMLDAFSSRIIPSGDGLPGAHEAGVVHFMDRAFETFMAPALSEVRTGIIAFENDVSTVHPDAPSFASLSTEKQIELMSMHEETPLFGTLRFLTIAGTFADPSYGGNRDKSGWTLIGFEDRHVWQPPFGYYDAQEGDQ